MIKIQEEDDFYSTLKFYIEGIIVFCMMCALRPYLDGGSLFVLTILTISAYIFHKNRPKKR